MQSEIQTQPLDERFAQQFGLLTKGGGGNLHPMMRGSAWLEFGSGMRVYIRIGPRLLDSYRMCVTVANIVMPNAETRKGRFTNLIRHIRALNEWPILLENCRTDFANHLLRKGWVQISTDGFTKNIARYH